MPVMPNRKLLNLGLRLLMAVDEGIGPELRSLLACLLTTSKLDIEQENLQE